MDDYVSFDDKEADLNPYPKVLDISLSIARVTMPKLLDDIGSALIILYASMLQ